MTSGKCTGKQNCNYNVDKRNEWIHFGVGVFSSEIPCFYGILKNYWHTSAYTFWNSVLHTKLKLHYTYLHKFILRMSLYKMTAKPFHRVLL